jgi:hypothetical protein
MVTSTIAMIRTTDMWDRCRIVESGRSLIFTRTKRGTDEATWAKRAMMESANTAAGIAMAAVLMVAAVTDRG